MADLKKNLIVKGSVQIDADGTVKVTVGKTNNFCDDLTVSVQDETGTGPFSGNIATVRTYAAGKEAMPVLTIAGTTALIQDENWLFIFTCAETAGILSASSSMLIHKPSTGVHSFTFEIGATFNQTK